MRRRLILVFVAVSTLVALAFVVPLGFLVARTAEDRSLDGARADAAAIVPALVAGATRDTIESVMLSTDAGRQGRLTVVTSQGWNIGPDVEMSERMDAALRDGLSAIGSTAGGIEVVSAVATGPDQLSVIRVFVPDAQRREGQYRAWGALAGVGGLLVLISVVVADRLSRSVVQPTQDLAAAARRLGDGDLDSRVDPDGPEELVELADVFNALGSRVSGMLERERELVAELSHRLRTPLTKLRMRLDQVDDAELAAQLAIDLDDVTAVVNDLIHEARGLIEASSGCDAADVVTRRAEFWQVLAEDQERPWRFEPGGGPLRVQVPEAELAAAIDVVLENAFSYTDEGVALSVGFEAGDETVRIWVADAGPGFSEESLERGTSGSGSTGLGLDIVRRLADKADGSFVVGAGRLGGAEVMLVLPLDTSRPRERSSRF
ncbi:MAG: HAMP domain-containing sensor histidine kinase [Acidimicrobiales bacterium]